MSTEIKFRQQLRTRKRKQKFRRNIIAVILIFIIITVFALYVKGIFSQKDNNDTDVDFIFNGYVYPEPPPKNTDILVDAQKSDGVKTAYLTFDDGPNKSVTPKILDVLRRYNVKATFFAVGNLIEQNPDVARRLYDEGHLIANHSYSHKYNELYADSNSFMNEIEHSNDIIKNIVCRENYPKILRFPGGSYEVGSHAEAKKEIKSKLSEYGYRYCDWNSLTGDAESKSPSADYLVNRLKDSSKGKEDLVILMHDSVSKTATAQTLPQILDYLIEQGYTFSTLDKI